MIRLFMVSDMCEHPGSHKDVTILNDSLQVSCRTCERVESQPLKNLSAKQVRPDECLRLAGIDPTPYMQPTPKGD